MLKTISSITNAIGALNFVGTWNASTNSPALVSSVGTKGDYYVVGTAGSTTLNGISNWGVGDLATFNGSIWERVEGGADGNFVNLSATGSSSVNTLSVSGVTTIQAGTALLPAIIPTGDPNTGVFFPAANTVAVSTDGAEAFRVDSTGNMIIGTTSTALWVGTENLTSFGFSLFKNAGTPVLVWNTDASGGLVSFSAANRDDVGSISTNGTVTAYNTSSDYRLKENVAPMQNALATVAQLKPCTYTWKSNGSDGQGFIAHELQEVVPDCVTGEKDALDVDGNPKYQGVDTSFLISTIVAAIQELKIELDLVKSKLT
jgi:hypothetical protein